MKSFDKWPDGTVSPDDEFNGKVAKADAKIIETQEEHDSTNHGLQIEMRNKPAAHFMRVEIPQSIIDEVLENQNSDDQDFKDNLSFVFQQIGKTFLKKNFQLEKKLNIDWRFDDKDMFIDTSFGEWEHQIQMLLFFEDGGETTFTWGKEESKEHQLRPAVQEKYPHEKGVLLVFPSWVKCSCVDIGKHMDIKVSYR